MTISDSEDYEQHVRDSLLRYYSGSNNAHGPYLLAVAIGVFTFIQSISVVEQHVHGLWFTLYLSFMISMFSFAGSYLLVRTLYWGCLASTPIWTQPISRADMLKELQQKHPGIALGPEELLFGYRLHYQCIKEFKRNNPIIDFLNSAKRLFLIVFVPMIVLLIIHFNWQFLSTLCVAILT